MTGTVKIHKGISGGLSLIEMIIRLRMREVGQVCAAPDYIEAASKQDWAWSVSCDGEFMAGAAIIPDGEGRGWLAAYPADALKSYRQIAPLVKLLDIERTTQGYTSLRCWVDANDARAIRFAEFTGFVYDCGPATGICPTGRDMNLHLWRPDHERHLRRGQSPTRAKQNGQEPATAGKA